MTTPTADRPFVWVPGVKYDACGVFSKELGALLACPKASRESLDNAEPSR